MTNELTQPRTELGPLVNCPQLFDFNSPSLTDTDWATIAQVFAALPSSELGQAWLDAPEPGFQPAIVRVGWEPAALWVYAEMRDLDISNSARTLNEWTWLTGDVFEMFLRPLPARDWYEFHVTPENYRLQLNYPCSPEEFRAVYDNKGMQPFYIEGQAFDSWALAEHADQQWRALARIPAASIVPGGIIEPGDEWLFSFCRYDYTRGEERPVLSSTSPHGPEMLLFNRQQEWGRLVFEAPTTA